MMYLGQIQQYLADAAIGESKGLCCMQTYQIETWNVGGMNWGKLDINKCEMDLLRINLLGASNLHWSDKHYFQSEECIITWT